MSFALTTDQIRRREKTVTRRLGWQHLKPGTLIRAVVKCQGLRKGEAMQPLAVLCVVGVRRERLDELTERSFGYGRHELDREGFPSDDPIDKRCRRWVRMFCETHPGCTPETEVTRIEFRYVPGGRLE